MEREGQIVFGVLAYVHLISSVSHVSSDQNRMCGTHYCQQCQRLKKKIVVGEKSAILGCIIYVFSTGTNLLCIAFTPADFLLV